MKPRPIPPAAPWLEQIDLGLDAALRKRLVRRAFADIGIEEQTGAANRSPYLDRIAAHFGSPPGSAWCALIAGWWCYEMGAAHPPALVGAVRAWWAWAERKGLRVTTPTPGDLVIYDLNTDTRPDHMGIVARCHARGVRAVEGNTSYAGFSREGVACLYKPVAHTRIAGYIRPREV